MKILHTGDWHIGKIVNEYSMLEVQDDVIKQLYNCIEEQHPDVIVIAGDIYDRSIPPKEAVLLLDSTLTKIVEEYQIPILMISGNHDSSERLSFGNKMLEHKQLYIEGKCNGIIKKVTLKDDYGPINFYLLPYVNPLVARHLFQDETLTDHHETMKYFVNNIKIEANLEERNILVNHNFFAPLHEEVDQSESERSLSIGGTEIINVELVKDFDYVALGHLHKPQKVKYDHIRYSGSLLKYSFSEINYDKGINIIELKEKGNINIQFCPFKPLRDLVQIKGTLRELISKDFYSKIKRDDYMRIVLTDEQDVYDPFTRLRAVYPNIMEIERENFKLRDGNEKRSRDFKEKSAFDLFSEFYTFITSEECDDETMKEVELLMDQITKGELYENQ